MNNILRTFLLGASALLLSSCAGYTLGPAKPEKMAAIKTIAVPTFKNSTLEPRISVLLTNAVIKEIQRDGSYQITNTANADAILRGTVSNIMRRSARQTRAVTPGAAELSETVTVTYTLTTGDGNAALMAGGASGKTNFVLDQNLQLAERQAFNEVFRRIAIEINSEISEGW